MKFRIIRYYDRYQPQVLKQKGYHFEDQWIGIGLPNGYATIDEARNCCKVHKKTSDEKIVEEFEL